MSEPREDTNPTHATTMFFGSLSESSAALLRYLRLARYIRTEAVESTMQAVDRGFYAPRPHYTDCPLDLGHGATISAPHMHAHCLEEMAPILSRGAPQIRALDVGCGSGYLTACMATMARQAGSQVRVYGIDVVPALVELSRENIRRGNPELLVDPAPAIVLKLGDGHAGLQEGAPYDAIHVGAAAAELPRNLVDQLAPGGVLILPIGPAGGDQWMTVVKKGTQGRS